MDVIVFLLNYILVSATLVSILCTIDRVKKYELWVCNYEFANSNPIIYICELKIRNIVSIIGKFI